MSLHSNMNEMRQLGVGPDRLWRFVRGRNINEHNKRVAECRARKEPRVVTRIYGVEESDDGKVWSHVILQADPMQQALDETADTNAAAARRIEELERDLRTQVEFVKQLREERDLLDRKLTVWIKRSDEGFASFRENVERLSAERDKARAERDELRAKLEEAQRHSPTGYVHYQMYNQMKERAEKAEHRIELFKSECVYVHKERDAANASLREARAEADALRGEVAKLKEDRAVIDAWNNGQKIECRLKGTDTWNPCDDPLWCYESHDYRIRAAGVEVES